MKEKVSIPRATRREILKGLGLSVSVIALPCLGGSAGPSVVRASELQSALTPYTEPPRRDPSHRVAEYPDKSQVVVKENPAIQKLPQSKTAFAVVHAGFVAAELSAMRLIYGQDNPSRLHDADVAAPLRDIAEGKLGDLDAHQARMGRLLSALALSEQTVLSYVEEPDLYNAATPRKPFLPPANSLQIATEDASPRLAEAVQYFDSGRLVATPQATDTLYSNMQQAGVETIYIAGEYTFNPWNKRSACLGGVALDLMDYGFNVRAIEGAVFPTHPQPGIDRDSDLAHAMYDQTIPLHEAVNIARE